MCMPDLAQILDYVRCHLICAEQIGMLADHNDISQCTSLNTQIHQRAQVIPM